MTQDQPSKSKRVQDYLRANPRARNRDVVEALKEFGVTAADVSNAKAHLKKKFTRRRSATAVVATELPGEVSEDETISLGELELTMDFVQAVGGVHRAQQLLAIVQQIQELG